MDADRLESAAPAPAATAFLRHYDRLVRIAFLVAPPTRSRLVRAHRLVQRSLPWRSRAVRTYHELVARVLRRAARPHRLGLPSLPGWARHSPVGGNRGHRAIGAALATAPAPVRAAYVLLMVERLPAREAVVLLHAAGWAEGVAHVAAATALRQRLADELGISAERQRALLADAPADPTVVRLRAPDPVTLRVMRVVRFGAAALALAVIATLVTATQIGAPPRRPAPAETVGRWAAPEAAAVAVRRVSAGAWAGASELSVASWPARGARAGDEEFVRTAVAAWQGLDAATEHAGTAGGSASLGTATVPARAGRVAVSTRGGAVVDPPVGTPQLLYAGELDGSTVAVLAADGRIATYAVRGDERDLRIEPAPGPDADTASAIRVGLPDGASRYVVAPWVARLETRTSDGRGWRPLTLSGGVSEPVPARAGDCWAGPLLRLRSAEIGDSAPFLLADLGGAALTRLRYLPPTVNAAAASPRLDSESGAAVWSRLGCPVGDLRGRAPESVTAWELWRGRLPQVTATFRLVCLRAAFPGDGNRVSAVLLSATGAATVASASGTRLCSRLAPDAVVAWWWKSPGGGWHHLAVGGGKVRTIEVTVAGRTRRGGPLVVSGPYPKPRGGPVTVRATARDGKAVPVLR